MNSNMALSILTSNLIRLMRMSPTNGQWIAKRAAEYSQKKIQNLSLMR